MIAFVIVTISACNYDSPNSQTTNSAHVNYSIFDDYIDPTLTTKHEMRLTDATRSPDVNVGKYTYNGSGKVTQRAYLDGTFNYEYNADGTLKKASSLIDPAGSMIIAHTKENVISEYVYEGGRVVSETKKVFPITALDLDGDPEVTYVIVYLYNEKNQLVQRNQFSKESNNSIVYDYTFNSDDRMIKIDEIKKAGDKITNRDLLYLTYDQDGEITKAIHKKQEIGANGTHETVVQTVDIDYYSSSDMAYPFYYVDPVKEWKVDRDFFALSYHLISEITTTEGAKSTKITYEYKNINSDFFPENFTSTMTVSDGNPANSITKQFDYNIQYATFSY